MSTITAPATVEPATTTYQFLVPGHVTVSVPATSEAEARELLEMGGGDTLELDHHGPLKVGGLSLHGVDLTPLAAKVDKIGEEIQDGSMPDADFSVSDIARLAAEGLEGDWTSCPGTGGTSGDLTSDSAAFAYTLEVVDGTLSLFHQDYATPRAQFEFTYSLRELVDQVIAAVLRDVKNG